MNVASLENCKELYELSGWDDIGPELIYGKYKDDAPALVERKIVSDDWKASSPTYRYEAIAPAYDAGYLLRKLPMKLNYRRETWGLVLTRPTIDNIWIADYMLVAWTYPLPEHEKDIWLHNSDRAQLTEADTPEDALAKLAIELFKQGILGREAK